MMNRRDFAAAAALAICAAPLNSHAQPTAKRARIGYLLLQPTEMARPYLRSFEERLRQLGLEDARDVVFEACSADGRVERLDDCATDLIQRGVDVIVAVNHAAVATARRATSSVPIVMVAGGDPVGMGWATTLARPGGNVTGRSSIIGPGLAGKRLAILKEAVTGLSRVGVLWWPGAPEAVTFWSALQDPARTLGLTLSSQRFHDAKDLDRIFEAFKAQPPNGLIVSGDTLAYHYRRRIVELVAAIRRPAIYSWSEFVEGGGLMSYGLDVFEGFRSAADYVAKILRGARPGDLPIEQPAKFEMVINLKTARALGLTMPPTLLLRADRVIE